ncbi:hypothetical protein ACU686_12070 [Yinghuangia aomiensis]
MSLDDPHHIRRDLDSLNDDVHGLAGLKSEVNQARSEIDESMQALRYELVSDIEDAQEAANSAAERIDGLEAALARLTSRVDWLERHARVSDGGEPFNLDRRDRSVQVAAKAIRTGRELHVELLSEAQRQSLAHTEQVFQATLKRWESLRAGVLASSRALATTDPASAAYEDAATQFHQDLASERATRRQLADQADAVKNARAVLAGDDALRASHTPQIDAATAAERDLYASLRDRIGQALNDGRLLPVWFTTAFGPLPPKDATEAWLDTATRALLHRVVYGISDMTLVLGPHIPADELSARYAEFTKLQREIRDLGR